MISLFRVIPVVVASLLPLPDSPVKDFLPPLVTANVAAQPPDTNIDSKKVSVICKSVTL